ncbi:MAG: ABC transporter ATP-binding protein [Acidimicrobiales bacterium]
MTEPALQLSEVRKTYHIVDAEHRPSNLREALMQRARHPLSDNIGRDTFVALDDVTLEVEQGEILGLIGQNGAGKSTLLKVLTRISGIDRGSIRVWGRIGSLLEVGTGFHPDLTGRENIFLNGAILGMSRAEIAKKLDSIVAFAELSTFLETPVKRYSSGMAVRLAFSVAVHLDAEILLIDEVLAVGDAAFQEKCMAKMDEIVSEEGRTIVLVSHNMGSIRRMCTRAALVDHGRLATVGAPADVIQRYLEVPVTSHQPGCFDLAGRRGSVLRQLIVNGADGYPCNALEQGEPARLDIALGDLSDIDRPAVGVRISADGGLSVATFVAPTSVATPTGRKGIGSVSLNIASVPLTPGRYHVDLSVMSAATGKIVDEIRRAGSFLVTSRRGDMASYRTLHGDGVVTITSGWSSGNQVHPGPATS